MSGKQYESLAQWAIDAAPQLERNAALLRFFEKDDQKARASADRPSQELDTPGSNTRTPG
jgi:hypothetical protein